MLQGARLTRWVSLGSKAHGLKVEGDTCGLYSHCNILWGEGEWPTVAHPVLLRSPPPTRHAAACKCGWRNGNDTETIRPAVSMKRLSLEAKAWETHASNSLNVAAGYDETVNPGANQNRAYGSSGIARYGAQLECRTEQKELTPPNSC